MRKKSEVFHYVEYDSAGKLPAMDQNLLEHATNALLSAYTPYSQFRVGAAVLLEDGTVVTGNNQENRAFPSGLCAERVAMFSAGANYPDIPVKAIAITAHSDGFSLDDPVPPCGACRQVMLEYELHQSKDIRVILGSESGKTRIIGNVRSLLPLAFTESRFGKNRLSKL